MRKEQSCYKVVASQNLQKRGGGAMGTYEILSLLFLGGTFLVALLTYIDRNNKRKQISLPCYLAGTGRLLSI